MPQILLVEDDPDAALTIRDMLEFLGYQVTSAGNGKEALRLVDSGFRPQIVLTDILMPEMDGLETTLAFAQRLSGVPVVAMCAQLEAPYLSAAKMLGARETLSKPFNLAQLKQTLALAMEGP